MTAYTGLLNIGQPKAGETVVVAAATGPVGSLVGQIAKRKGARAVGIAGGPEKCAYLRDTLGFDAAIDHRAEDFPDALAAACPNGIDVYFENVGGAVFDAVLPLLNDFARMPVCGLVSGYNATELPPGPDRVAGADARDPVEAPACSRASSSGTSPPRRPSSCARSAAGCATASWSIARTSSTAWRTRPKPSRACCKGRNFGKLIVRIR